MKLWLAQVRRGEKVGLVPTDDLSRAVLGRMGDGECAEVEFVRPRSVQMHRMYFGICRQIGLNQEPQRDESSIDHELRILAGHYNVLHIGRKRIPWWFSAAASLLGRHGRIGAWLTEKLRIKFTHDEVLVPKRIAFHKLTHEEWMELWPSIELAIRERFGSEYLREAA